MTLVRWDPFREMDTLHRRMGRLFGEGLDRPMPRPETLWMPNVDIREDEDMIVLKAELPDMEEKDIDLKVEDSVLTLRGERKMEHEEKKDDYHLIESSYGSFHRAFTLPTNADSGKITAEYTKGVLRVTIPKTEEAKPKQIKVETK